MSHSVTMPALGESVTEGTVTRWLKQEGEQVEADEPLLEVSTDKVDTEIPSPASGTLQRILVAEDETVAVGAELAVIGDGDGGAQQGDAQQGGEQGGEQQGGEQQAGDESAQPETEQPAEQQPEPAAEQQPEPPQQSAEQQPEQSQQDGSQQGGSAGSSGGTTVTMPALGESVTEGTVTRWLKQEGEQVEADEPLLEVSTDKVDTEIPSPASGVLQRILVAEDETVPVGAELAVIGGATGKHQREPEQQSQPDQPQQQEQEPAPQQAEPQQAEPQQAEPQQVEPQQPAYVEQQVAPAPAQAAPTATPQEQQSPTSETGEDDGGRTYVTPLVRKLAGEHGVDLSGLRGTGVGGRIRKQDVLEAAAKAREAQQAPAAAAASPSAGSAQPAAPSPLRGTTEKMSRLRTVIAKRMVESLQTSAQLTTVVEVDLTRVARLRARAKTDFEAREGVKLSFLPFLAKATVEALKVHPVLNAKIDADKGEITYYDAEHLGIAVDTERGLLVPVLRNAGDLNIAGLSRKIADLAARTRNNKITPDELADGTFTLTNTGSRGALFDTPIINQPQVGILGTGAVVKRAVVVDDADLGETIAIRSMCYLALSYDHRLVDGADGARFLVTVKSRLEEGAFESDLGL